MESAEILNKSTMAFQVPRLESMDNISIMWFAHLAKERGLARAIARECPGAP
jgi:hypothetical protein